MKRVVITGLGILSSIGNNKKDILHSLKNSISGITFSKEFKDSGMRSHIWGNINLSNCSYKINRKIYRFMNKASIYAYLSMKKAILDSNLTDRMISNERTGIIVGSGNVSPSSQYIVFNKMKSKGLKGIDPYIVIKSMSSGISACLSTSFKIRGISYSISSACATSSNCIGHAFELIQTGKQDIIFAGGGEELSWEIACAFDAIGALSKNFNKTPQQASRPYDLNRDGFVISGGGGILVIEELKHALYRNAHIYAEIIGYGTNSDGDNMVIPSEEGAKRCMNMAMKNVKLKIDYINVHGTSTVIGDIKELLAIKNTFGNDHPYFSSTKSITGHSLGSSGVHEVIFTLLMLENNFISPSVNIYQEDPHLSSMNIIKNFTKCELNTVMVNNFGFGGINASLVMRKYYK
ncbi:MAG: beta-ketoacyl synthase N-terminal-like domain-containing protein [Enterobacterales bacterium]